MTDEALDPRFERELRAMLAASEPADVPETLYAFVGAVPQPATTILPPARRGWDRRALAVLMAAAVLAIVAVGIGSGIVRLPGILPQVGGPIVAPGTRTYRLYYEVEPLDRHTPTADELQRALDVLMARAGAYQSATTGQVPMDIPSTVAVDIEVPADDPGRLAELRQVLPTEGGMIIGTVTDGTVEVGGTTDGVAFEPAFGSGAAFTPTLRPDGSALDLAIEPVAAASFGDWARAHIGQTAVVTTSDGEVVALAPITVPAAGGSWAIPFTPDQMAAGDPHRVLALFSAGTLQNPVREVAPQGVELAPGITPEPLPTPTPTVAPGNELRLEYQVEGSTEAAATIAILSDRIRAAGITSFDIADEGGGRISITLPVAADDPGRTQLYRAIIGTTGRLDFVPLGDTPASSGEELDLVAHPPLFSGDQVVAATLGYDQTGERTVDFTLGPEGTSLFADHTAQHLGQYFAIVLDGVVISAPVINSSIPDGRVQITQGGTGGDPESEAQELVAILAGGALPFPLREVAGNAVDASPTASPAAKPTSLSVAGYADGCASPGGCTYAVDLRSALAQWRADLAIDAQGQATAGEGMPATLAPGDYTVTATSRRNPDALGGGMGAPGPVDATCTSSFSVTPGDDVMVVSATFGAGSCTVSAGVPSP